MRSTTSGTTIAPASTRRMRIAAVASASLTIGYGVAALLFGSRSPAIRLCPFYLVTRRDCPLCGLTRALGLIGEGHAAEAFKRHGLALASGALLAAFAVLRISNSNGQASKER